MSRIKHTIRNVVISLLTWEAKRALRKHTPAVVAITGSVGKTTTKDTIAAALETTFSVRKSTKSFNSEIGIPLTILGLKNPWSNPIKWCAVLIRGFFVSFQKSYPAWLVLEVGADQPGDISSLSHWLRTHVVVFTQFAETPVHVAHFSSAEAILDEKLSLIRTLTPEGTVVVNADDAHFSEGVRRVNRNAPVITYGLMLPADIINPHIRTIYNDRNHPAGIEFDIQTNNTSNSITLRGVLGKQHVYPILAAYAVAEAVGIEQVALARVLESTPRASGRMRILEGVKNTTLIDDTYNSSPVAAHEALNTLEALSSDGKKIVVLGDMLELGTHAQNEHIRLGERAAAVADIVIAVGEHGRDIAHGALTAGLSEKHIVQSRNAIQAGKAAQLHAKEHDVILLKGSQGTRMEHAVLELLQEPQRANELLVRQEKEWEKR